ncbi:response regulator [Mucilaginibacter aquaedulcis]|uniref:response regulator n=1 Tax=Mucilaginibacter aquaedulcis TaxID=1187081 RepID=UPI0025B33A58|nr:response regulator [Mucilaginibacter aquaedulcis]MDN3551190.1 response regulator [Mucilaginibacter aquaedulcis]
MVKRILVIDDDMDILSIIGIIFFEEGYETVLLETGRTAEEIRHLRPDLILLDVRIVGYFKNGAEICKDIKSESALDTIPVILISAERDLEDLARACLANGFIRKPFDLDKLLIMVKNFLN